MRAIAIVFVALALAIATGSTQLRVPDRPFAFEVEVSSTTPGRIQVYYDLGRGFSEADSSAAALDASIHRRLVRLALPTGDYRAIRFDPIDGSGKVTFSHPRIATADGSVVRPLPLTAFAPNEQVTQYSVTRQVASFSVPDGRNDPNFTVVFETPLRLRFGWFQRLSYAARAAVIWFFVWLPLLAVVSAAWVHRDRLRMLVHGHPRATLWLAAAAMAVVGSYPVVFCGKSFVSPNITALLRASPPTIPGYGDTTRSELHAPDPAVLLWQNVPYSVVEHDALFRDHELPLWNRYLSCGVTLLGQGQSMLGDPLHLLVVAAGGESWAWDAKFVIAKAVFAAGVSTAVWVVTGDVIAALIAVVAAAFVGFFNYRFNHPAIFSFAYSPWILVGWAAIICADRPRELRVGLATWLIANIAVIGSGTAKEAYMLLAVLNGCGVMLWATAQTSRGVNALRRNLAIAATLLSAVAISAPLWVPFFDALREGTNAYTKPVVWQAPRAWVIGLFDDLFYAATNPAHPRFLPSANWLVLLGVVFVVTQRWRWNSPARFCAVVLAAAVGCVLLAHEFIPSDWIAGVPLLRSIYHVHNTFDAVAVVLLTMAAGCGFHAARETLSGPRKWQMALGFGVGTILLFVYFHDLRQLWSPEGTATGWLRGFVMHGFFYANVVAMVLACVALTMVARRRLSCGRSTVTSAVIAALALTALLYRHGLHVNFGFGESYLSFPMSRADLTEPSASAAAIRDDARGEAFRVVGTDLNLIAGWNAVYRLEGLNGPDAIMNREYRELVTTAGLVPQDDWRLQVRPEQLEQFKPVLDFLDTRYVLTDAPALPESAFAKISTGELNAFRSSNPWPRAFFVSELGTYRNAVDLIGAIRRSDAPFAAVQANREELVPAALREFVRNETTAARAEAISARDVRLTTNTTTFRLDTPGRGLAILQETWLPNDFVARVDGVPAPYYRVNHAFKAVVIPSAGNHTVSFSYWPEHLTLALWAALAGCLLFGFTLCALPRPNEVAAS